MYVAGLEDWCACYHHFPPRLLHIAACDPILAATQHDFPYIIATCVTVSYSCFCHARPFKCEV